MNTKEWYCSEEKKCVFRIVLRAQEYLQVLMQKYSRKHQNRRESSKQLKNIGNNFRLFLEIDMYTYS